MNAPGKSRVLIALVFIYGGCFSIEPANARLMAYWSFDAGLHDRIDNRKAKPVGKVETVPGYLGNALKMNGDSAYIELPIGRVLESLTDCTIAMWINPSNNNGYYARVFDFGNDTKVCMYLAAKSRFSNSIYLQITKTGYHKGFQDLLPNYTLPSGWHHVAVVVDSRRRKAVMYVDGAFLGENHFSLTPKSLGKIQNAWLGRSQNRSDPYFKGAFDEVAVFSHSLTHKEVDTLYRTSAEAFRQNKAPSAEQCMGKAELFIQQNRPKQAAAYLLRAISTHENSARGRGRDLATHEAVLAKMYYLLGRARELSPSPRDSISESFMKTAMLAPKGELYIEALSSVFKHSGLDVCRKTLQNSIHGSAITCAHMPIMVSRFKFEANWQVFSVFCDTLLAEVGDRSTFIDSIEKNLSQTMWSNRFEDYCQNIANRNPCNPELAGEFAEHYRQRNDFAEAAQIYIELSERLRDQEDKAGYKLKACQSLFSNGQYDDTGKLIDEMLKGSNATMANELYLLKGRLLIAGRQLGDAVDILNRVSDTSGGIGSYTQALYFKGYCQFLQHDYGSAKSGLLRLQAQYPDSASAKKASMLINRMNNT